MEILALILVATTLAGHLSKQIKIPAVIGQLLVGIILGPAVVGWIQPSEFITIFSEIGVVLLMFIAGMESDLELLKRYWKPSALVAVIGVFLPIICIYGLNLLFKINALESLFIGVIFAATSVSISVEVLRELDVLNSKEGVTILGAAVVDDLLAVMILSALTSMFSQELSSNTSAHISLLKSFGLQIIFFGFVIVLVKWLVPHIVHMGHRLLVDYSGTITALIICFVLVWLAEEVELSSVVGAFFAGIAVSQTEFKKEITRNIEPIAYTVFVPVFFVSVGLTMSFSHLGSHLLYIVLITIIAVVTKLFGSEFGARVTGFDKKGGRVIGAAMISRGEMALIIAQIGFQAKLLSQYYYSAIITSIILTTVIAPLILKYFINQQKEGLNA